MGNGVTVQKSTLTDLLRLYDIKEKNDQYTLFEQSNTKQYKEVWEFNFSDEQSAKNKEKQILELKLTDCTCLVKIIGHEYNKTETFCSTIHKLSLICEHPIQDLGEYLILRGNQDYREEEIWRLIDCIARAQIAIRQKQFLCFFNIFQCEEDVWKLKAFNQCNSFINIFKQQQSVDPAQRLQHVYPAPEEFKTTNLEKTYEKSTVFTFAMLLLHIATAKSCDHLYSSNDIDQQALVKRIKELRYSIQLNTLLGNMLQIDPFQRPDYTEILSYVIQGNHSLIQKLNIQQKTNQQFQIVQLPLQNHELEINKTPPMSQAKQLQSHYFQPLPQSLQMPNASFNENQTKQIPIQQEYTDIGQNRTGVLEFPNGGRYEGQIKNQQMHGRGTLFYEDGSLAYEGEFYYGKFHNFGHYFNKCPEPYDGAFDYANFQKLGDKWRSYEGDFQNDIRDGVGQLMLTNGETYMGSFKQNQLNGYGTFSTLSGKSISGYWENSKLIRFT